MARHPHNNKNNKRSEQTEQSADQQVRTNAPAQRPEQPREQQRPPQQHRESQQRDRQQHQQNAQQRFEHRTDNRTDNRTNNHTESRSETRHNHPNNRAEQQNQGESSLRHEPSRGEHQKKDYQRDDVRQRTSRNEQNYRQPSHGQQNHDTHNNRRGESRSDARLDARNENRNENRPESHRRTSSRPAPITPDFIPVGGGFDKPEDYEQYAATQRTIEQEAYEPYVPTTPAQGSDNIFYKDFDPIYKGARGLAIKILTRLDQSDSYLDKLLEYELSICDLKPLDRALLTEIVNGVTRWQGRLDWVLTGFYHGEFVKCIVPVKNAMRIALYQILFLQKIPPFAAVNESVELIKRLKGHRSGNLVNAILRNILHNVNNIRYPNKYEDLPRYLSVFYSHPFWMTKRWFDRLGATDAEELLKLNNERPKITLRLNLSRCNRPELLKFLDEQQVKYWDSTIDPERLLQVGSLSAVRDWMPFQEGWFSVQDSSAAMVVKLARPQAGQRIYDVCAAPGGKTTYAAELSNDEAEILAMDKYGGKLHLIEESAKRLGLKSIKTQAQDIRHFKTTTLADLVMVDAPCSGLGTLSKKPDIKWKFNLTDFTPLVKIQREILTASARLVKPGGTLVYSTCTIEPEENEQQVEWFLQQFPDFTLDRAENYLPENICSNGYMQTFPHKHNCDGAFAARLVKKK